jgi:general secretion pathway protein I
MKRRATAQGLTLIEVMVALAIVAVTLAAGVRAAGSLSNSAERLADVLAAQWCADNQLTDLRLQRGGGTLQGSQQGALSVGDTEFSCEQTGRSYRGLLVVRPTPNPNFRRVDAQVFDDQNRTLVRLITILR